eukprot:TRINITY_DN22476_c0_g1_i1.p2 TRINITY_DN22476_c0_g1~~TRINITY_DN22476_c0_g1_i1.p2  ORF type:complete len:237 (-),score=53.99 TRINITY_DN22476_c0_g1_i1:159-815(-)
MAHGAAGASLLALLAGPTPINECEEDFAVTPLVAEFFCAATSAVLTAALALLALLARSGRARWLALGGCIATASSTAYHVVLTRGALALDQLALALLGGIMQGRPWLALAGLLAILDYRLGAAVYIPSLALGFRVLLPRILDRRRKATSPGTRRDVWRLLASACVLVSVGLLSFALEIFHVETRRPCALPFHAIWHVLAGTALALLVRLVDFAETGSL